MAVVVPQRFEMRNVSVHRVLADRRRIRDALRGEVPRVPAEIPAVRLQRVRREPALDREPLVVLRQQRIELFA